jgi:hypothetical protein
MRQDRLGTCGDCFASAQTQLELLAVSYAEYPGLNLTNNKRDYSLAHQEIRAELFSKTRTGAEAMCACADHENDL